MQDSVQNISYDANINTEEDKEEDNQLDSKEEDQDNQLDPKELEVNHESQQAE